jgi:two-component system, NarL family, nitrate/nitrite response regulator NarL
MVGESAPLTAQLFSDALRRRGFIVEQACKTFDVAAAVEVKPDVFLLSKDLEGTAGRGLAILKELRAQIPQTRAVLLMDACERDPVVEAFRSGARGVFSRHDPVDLLAKCVRRVHQGQLWMNDTQLAFLVDALANAISQRLVDAQGEALLSIREQDVVACLSKGFTNAEIAQELRLSENTVRNYLFRIFDKLGVSSRVELLKYVASRQ